MSRYASPAASSFALAFSHSLILGNVVMTSILRVSLRNKYLVILQVSIVDYHR
jgi:hypothetical protein